MKKNCFLIDNSASLSNAAPSQNVSVPFHRMFEGITHVNVSFYSRESRDKTGALARVLFVEDNARVGELYREEFEEEGYMVEVAADGYSVVERVREWQPHIIVFGIGLSEKSGFEVLSDLCQEGQPVIINTAYPLFRVDFRAHCTKAWVMKSSDLKPLKTLVRRTLHEAGVKEDG